MRKPVTLIGGQFGSRHFGTRPYLEEALRLTRKQAPTALYVGAANGDDASFGIALCALSPRPVRRRHVAQARRRHRAKAAARSALERVDFVFVGGGDVEAGMDVLRRAQLVANIHAAAARGVVFAGMSAGAIMLGERWIRWPHEDAGDDEAETYECLGLAPCSLDTHGEGDDWREARSFAAVRARETRPQSEGLRGAERRGARRRTGGRMCARGEAVPVFTALPGRASKLERTLPVKT